LRFIETVASGGVSDDVLGNDERNDLGQRRQRHALHCTLGEKPDGKWWVAGCGGRGGELSLSSRSTWKSLFSVV
jgi:hypothetical protein